MIDKEKFIGFEKHEYAPIIREKTAQLLTQLLHEKKPQKVLEIGTFLGCSASLILQECPNCFLKTVEKDVQNVADAKQNLENLGFGGRFEVVCCDAIEFLERENSEQYDFIFLDGPKGQYYKYYPLLKAMLKSGGVLMADDIMYYGLVKSNEKIIHKHRSIVNNLRKFLQIITTDAEMETTVYDFEDGVSVSIKK